MRTLFTLLTLLFTLIFSQTAIAEDHIAPDEPVIVVPEDEPVVIVDAPEPPIMQLIEPAPNVSITINTGGRDSDPFGMSEYDRGFNDGYDTALGLETTEISVEETTAPDGTVNVEVTLNDDTTEEFNDTLDEPVMVMDPDATNDAALGISPEFRAALNAHTLAVLNWQLKTSERVLWLIMFMSTAGIVFAGYQLWRSFDGLGNRAPTAAGEAPAPQPAQANSTVSFDKGKFEVSSPVVGILVLVISLGALYMFLNFVYQIDVVPVGGTAEVTQTFE